MIGVLALVLCSAALGSADVNPLVVNGTDATLGEYPFMVSLRYNDRHLCGAALLSPNWVLTAAHCVQEVQNLYSVQAGTIVTSEAEDYIIDVRKIFYHEKYNASNGYINDIAVLQLEDSFDFDITTIGPTTLPDETLVVPAGTDALLLGWGRKETDGPQSTILQKAALKVVSDEKCAEDYSGHDQLHSTNICAGVPDGGIGQCSGDSGGPLLVKGQQVGVVSFSHKPCASPGFPGVFTEVAQYVPWLVEKVTANGGQLGGKKT